VLARATFLLLVAASRATALPARPLHAPRCHHIRCSAAPGADDVAASRRAFLAQQRPTSGIEAFANTQWSLLLKMKGGGGTMFTVELLEDMRCRFSDSEELGESCRQRTNRPVVRGAVSFRNATPPPE